MQNQQMIDNVKKEKILIIEFDIEIDNW